MSTTLIVVLGLVGLTAQDDAATDPGEPNVPAGAQVEVIQAAPVEIEETPVLEEEPLTPAKELGSEIDSQDELALGVRGVESPKRKYRATGLIEHYRPFVLDDDPENELTTVFRASGGYEVLDGGWAKLELGTDLHHSYEAGESPWEFRDVALRFQYNHSVPWKLDEFELGLPKRDIDLRHTLSLYLPTSRTSRIRDKYYSLSGLFEGSMRVLGDLFAGADLFLQYNAHEFDRARGPGGRPFTVFTLSVGGSVEYAQELPLGNLAVGAWLGQQWNWRYISSPVRPLFGYQLYASYTPLYYVTASLSMEHEVARRRADGAVQNDGDLFFNRDITAIVARLTGRF